MGNKSSVRMTFVPRFQTQEKIAHIFFFGEAGTLFFILSPSSYLLPARAIKELADRRGICTNGSDRRSAPERAFGACFLAHVHSADRQSPQADGMG